MKEYWFLKIAIFSAEMFVTKVSAKGHNNGSWKSPEASL
jgi:hypothetical protein